MDTRMLEEHIRALAALTETDDPVISCYAAVENGRVKSTNMFEEQIRALQMGLKDEARRSFENALAPVRSFLTNRLVADAKGRDAPIGVPARKADTPVVRFRRARATARGGRVRSSVPVRRPGSGSSASCRCLVCSSCFPFCLLSLRFDTMNALFAREIK